MRFPHPTPTPLTSTLDVGVTAPQVLQGKINSRTTVLKAQLFMKMASTNTLRKKKYTRGGSTNNGGRGGEGEKTIPLTMRVMTLMKPAFFLQK